jgi:hypothetical protein
MILKLKLSFNENSNGKEGSANEFGKLYNN